MPTTTATTATTEAVDRIVNRQVAKCLAHLRKCGRYSDPLASDVHRVVLWTAIDVCQALSNPNEPAKENCHGQPR